jgi:polyisoprenoid-binding protein YceI
MIVRPRTRAPAASKGRREEKSVMSKRRLLTTLALLLAVVAPAAHAAATTYAIDRGHTLVGFSVRHFVTQVQGKFTEFEGSIVYDPEHPETSSVEFTVQATSIDTAVKRRDDHLRSPDFFDAAKFPTLSFKSTKVVPTGKEAAAVTGELTLHGVTKTITASVKLTGVMDSKQFGKQAGFQTSFTIDRKDYGIVWNKVMDVGGMMLGDEVTINLDVAAVFRPKTPAGEGEAKTPPAR